MPGVSTDFLAWKGTRVGRSHGPGGGAERLWEPAVPQPGVVHSAEADFSVVVYKPSVTMCLHFAMPRARSSTAKLPEGHSWGLPN